MQREEGHQHMLPRCSASGVRAFATVRVDRELRVFEYSLTYCNMWSEITAGSARAPRASLVESHALARAGRTEFICAAFRAQRSNQASTQTESFMKTKRQLSSPRWSKVLGCAARVGTESASGTSTVCSLKPAATFPPIHMRNAKPTDELLVSSYQ